ncbi:serine/threonine-protein kinase [Pseudactinotalea sp. HY158]|uniref:serine/threonine-protein kinase n=1 Tax=Pseudactinotalea sp. HY158 TaxID=2654547 RepID=UPI00129CA9D8|nr:serine/threonine-protein kinase [Pseudactinotalea sp. HY158]QGH68184.1 protein kinase [Pseudactinotalea sp. HY158]
MAEVGRYRLGEVIGVGSFATVYRASDDWLDSTVVVKILAENHSLNPEIRERFIGEGRSLRKISSPHVIAVHDIGETERQQPYLVLEYADRGTLADRVRRLRARSWTTSPADALALAHGLAAAVEAVHAAGLVHRDLSPGNVLFATDPAGPGRPAAAEPGNGSVPTGEASLVAPGERIVLADLGLCKDLAVNSGLTVAGGTQGFRPPEQHGGPALVDHRADLWAMSRLLVWATEGADLPSTLSVALRRSLAADPAARHPDTASWLADVRSALVPTRLGPGVPSVGEPRVPRRPRGRRGHRVAGVVAAGALVIGGTIGAGLTHWFGGTPDHTGAARISITGPGSVPVGEGASFTAEVHGADTWVWILPDGRYVLDQTEVSLTANSAGTADVTIHARDAAGVTIEATRRLVVTE